MTRRATDTQTILRHWREAVPNDRLAHLVKDATRALVRALSVRLAGHKVSFGHWAFLRILWERDGITQRELSEQAGVMEPTTFAAVKAMERLGYVARRKVSGDQKRIYISLTRRGRLLKKQLVPLAENVNEIAIRGCKPADVNTARQVLFAVISNLASDELAQDRPMPSTRALAARRAKKASP
jgi:DNA-binding MarR family transcriptional regulator